MMPFYNTLNSSLESILFFFENYEMLQIRDDFYHVKMKNSIPVAPWLYNEEYAYSSYLISNPISELRWNKEEKSHAIKRLLKEIDVKNNNESPEKRNHVDL
jgi:hypothetical protein